MHACARGRPCGGAYAPTMLPLPLLLRRAEEGGRNQDACMRGMPACGSRARAAVILYRIGAWDTGLGTPP